MRPGPALCSSSDARSGGGGETSPNPDVLTDGVYRLRNLGSRALLDHTAQDTPDIEHAGQEVPSRAPTRGVAHAGAQWAVALDKGVCTLVNLLTGLYLQPGAVGQPAAVGPAAAKFDVQPARQPLGGFTCVRPPLRPRPVLTRHSIKAQNTDVALHEAQGAPGGAPLAVRFARADASVNQRWWFERVACVRVCIRPGG